MWNQRPLPLRNPEHGHSIVVGTIGVASPTSFSLAEQASEAGQMKRCKKQDTERPSLPAHWAVLEDKSHAWNGKPTLRVCSLRPTDTKWPKVFPDVYPEGSGSLSHRPVKTMLMGTVLPRKRLGQIPLASKKANRSLTPIGNSWRVRRPLKLDEHQNPSKVFEGFVKTFWNLGWHHRWFFNGGQS